MNPVFRIDITDDMIRRTGQEENVKIPCLRNSGGLPEKTDSTGNA